MNPSDQSAPRVQATTSRWIVQPKKAATPSQPKSKVTGRGNKWGSSLISEGGALGGAAAGAAIGSVLPGIGTAVGGLAGGILGAVGGRLAENKVRDDRWGVKDALTEGAFNAIPIGTVAGKGAKGFAAAAKRGHVFEGVDKLPRFEIDDSKSFIKPKGLVKASQPGKAVPLQELLHHSQLYEQYPDLRNLKVRIDSQKSQGKYDKYIDRADGVYSPVEDTINLTSGGRGTLLHEIQHAVQKREGFANGGSPERATLERDLKFDQLDDQEKRLTESPAYERFTGVLRTRSGDLLPYSRGILTGSDDYIKSVSKETGVPLEEIQKLRDTPIAQTLGNEFRDITASRKNTPLYGMSSFDAYQRLGGEAEARAVSARADMSMSQRIKTPFYDSLDVPKDELIVKPAGITGKSMFVRRPDKPTELMATHNLSEDNLLHADKLGGIPQPSVGIVDPTKHAIDGFGEITLIGNNKLVDPKIAGNNTFASDVYSPRQPRSDLSIDSSGYKALRERYQPLADETGTSYLSFSSANDIVAAMKNEKSVMLDFLRSKGKKINNPKSFDQYEYSRTIREAGWNNDFDNYVLNVAEEAGAKPMLYAGHTPSGNRREVPETLENALHLMKKEGLRAGENAGGIGSIRAGVTPKLKSVDDIYAKKGKLTDSETMERTKEELEEKLSNIQTNLDHFAVNKSDNQFSEYDNQMQTIGDYLKGGKDAHWFNEKYPDLPEHLLDDLAAFKNQLQEAPTEYFESVPNRGVGLSEFEKALVPEDASPAVIQHLKANGIEPMFYNPKQGENSAKLAELSPAAAQMGEKGYTRKQLLKKLMDEDNAKRFNPDGTPKESRWRVKS